jgi:non-canonical purine NTP pyrophosphatase (RdgB/HAM1 family)
MHEILFATGNDRKIAEARAGCNDFSISIKQINLTIDEIQSHDPVEISMRKVEEAYRQTQSAVVITDTSWSILALNGFPGGYMKDVAEWFKPEDFINLVATEDDRSISFTETIIYKDADTTKVFSKKYTGTISAEARGSGNSVEQITEFDGYTLAERHDQGKLSHDPKDYIWYEFAKWFAEK